MTGILVVYFAVPVFQYTLNGPYLEEINSFDFEGPVARMNALSSAVRQFAGLGLAVLAVGLAASVYGRVAFWVGLVCASLVVVTPELLALGIVFGGLDGRVFTSALSVAERLFWVVPLSMGFALALACLKFYPPPLARSLFAALLVLSFATALLRNEAVLVYWGLLIALVIVFALRPSRRDDVPRAACPWLLASAASFALSFFIYVVPEVLLALGESSVSVRMDNIVKALRSPHFNYELLSAKALVAAALLSLNAGLPLRRLVLVYAALAIGAELILIATQIWLRQHMNTDFVFWFLFGLGCAVQFFALMVAILLHWFRPRSV